jgi:hypothetical protein
VAAGILAVLLFSCALLAGVSGFRSLDRGTLSPAEFPDIPKSSELRLELRSAELDSLDILALRGCDIQKTIGKYKSSIGQSASDSQRLLLALEYLRLARPCIEFVRASGSYDLADRLESAFALVENQLPYLIFNATLANAEFQAFSTRENSHADQPLQASGTVKSALEKLNFQTGRWLAGDYRADNMTFEILLSEIATANRADALTALYKLEDSLASVLPTAYTDWKTARDKH